MVSAVLTLDRPPPSRPGQAIFLEVARAIAEFEPVTFAADPDLVEDVQSRVAAAGPTVHPIDVRPIALNDSWTRDNGPMVRGAWRTLRGAEGLPSTLYRVLCVACGR